MLCGTYDISLSLIITIFESDKQVYYKIYIDYALERRRWDCRSDPENSD